MNIPSIFLSFDFVDTFAIDTFFKFMKSNKFFP